jgi:hypothetical protein
VVTGSDEWPLDDDDALESADEDVAAPDEAVPEPDAVVDAVCVVDAVAPIEPVAAMTPHASTNVASAAARIRRRILATWLLRAASRRRASSEISRDT